MSEQPAGAQPPSAMPTRGWRSGDVPGWVLALGLVVVAAAGLGLASLGGVGVVAVAVLQLAVLGVLYTWCASTAPPLTDER